MLLTLKVCKEDEFDNECERTVQIGKNVLGFRRQL